MRSLQHFKKAVAAAVVTTENSAPSTMSCGEVLQQLVSTAPAPVPAKAAAEEEAIPGGPFAAVLSTLEDLWPTEQYSELELDAFVQSIRST